MFVFSVKFRFFFGGIKHKTVQTPYYSNKINIVIYLAIKIFVRHGLQANILVGVCTHTGTMFLIEISTHRFHL